MQCSLLRCRRPIHSWCEVRTRRSPLLSHTLRLSAPVYEGRPGRNGTPQTDGRAGGRAITSAAAATAACGGGRGDRTTAPHRAEESAACRSRPRCSVAGRRRPSDIRAVSVVLGHRRAPLHAHSAAKWLQGRTGGADTYPGWLDVDSVTCSGPCDEAGAVNCCICSPLRTRIMVMMMTVDDHGR